MRWGIERGSDTYLYARGGGNDTIDEEGTWDGSSDRLILTGIDPAAVSLTRNRDDVLLTVAPSTSGGSDGGTITLRNQFDPYREKGIEQIAFADGTAWDRAAITSHLS